MNPQPHHDASTRHAARRHDHRTAGFTLAELLIVSALIGLIVMSSGTIMWQVSGARNRVDQRDQLNAELDAAIRTITTSIANTARSSGNTQIVFVGEDDEVARHPSDRLRLTSVSHKTVRPGEPESDLRLVEFLLTDAPDQSTTVLARRTDPTHNVPDDNGGVVDVIASGVISLNFEYFDGITWQDEWPEANGTAPSAVRVAIALADPERPTRIVGTTRLVALPWTTTTGSSTANTPSQEGGNP